MYYLEKVICTFDKPTRKSYIDAVYGILKGQSIILSDIAHSLGEKIAPKKTIERIPRFLSREYDLEFRNGLLSLAISMMPKNELKVFSVDDTDVSKPYGKCFESLGKVRDASSVDGAIGSSYSVSCKTALTVLSKHPMSIYDVFHSETKPGYLSANTYTFDGIEFVCTHLCKWESVFMFDRRYDDYKVINFVASHRQYFVIRVRKNRKIVVKTRKAGLISDGKRKKGKILIPFTYKGSKLVAKGSHIRVKLLDGNEYFAVYCYLGESSEPMTLLTNRPIKSKSDVVSVVMNYVSRWKIEEQFRFKKCGFNFEDFRARSLNRINNLTMCLDAGITIM